MHVLIDFTGPMLADTGGMTYARNMLPLWTAVEADELTALFSHGELPPELAGLGCTVELDSSLVPRPLKKVTDLHVRLRRQLRKRQIDVAYFPANFLAFALPSGLPKVVTIRSSLYYHYPGQTRLVKRLYRRAATYYTVRAADRIIVPSSALADDLMRFVGAKRHKIVVVPHGVDLDLFSLRDEAAVRPDTFLFASKPRDYKGLATVFRALREVDVRGETKAPRLVIADGGISNQERAAWNALAERLGIQSRIEFLGQVPHDRLREQYQEAAALIMPTSCESFGNVFLEAAAAGCPVITSSGHGIDETIGPVATQVPAHRHTDLAAAISDLMDTGLRKRRERSAASRRWAEQFPWVKTLDATRAVLAEVA